MPPDRINVRAGQVWRNKRTRQYAFVVQLETRIDKNHLVTGYALLRQAVKVDVDTYRRDLHCPTRWYPFTTLDKFYEMRKEAE